MKDPWRYRCPRGHASWQPRDTQSHHQAKSEYYCNACQKYHDDPHFNELQDMKA